MFSCEIYEMFKNTYFKENLQTTASLSFNRANFGDLFKHRGRENLKSFGRLPLLYSHGNSFFYIFHSAHTKISLRYVYKFFKFLVKFNVNSFTVTSARNVLRI